MLPGPPPPRGIWQIPCYQVSCKWLGKPVRAAHLRPLLCSSPLLWFNHGSGRMVPNLPQQCSPGAVLGPPNTTSSRLCPGISDLPLALLTPCRSRTRAVPPCKLDLTLVPTGPSLGLFPSLLLPRHWGGPGAVPGPTTLPSFGAGTKSRSPCTLLCCASAAHLLQRPGIIKRD